MAARVLRLLMQMDSQPPCRQHHPWLMMHAQVLNPNLSISVGHRHSWLVSRQLQMLVERVLPPLLPVLAGQGLRRPCHFLWVGVELVLQSSHGPVQTEQPLAGLPLQLRPPKHR